MASPWLPTSPERAVKQNSVGRPNKGHPVFLARIVKLDDQVYMIHNEHGFPVSLWPLTNSSYAGVQP